MIILSGASGAIGQGLTKNLSTTDSIVGLYNETLPKSPTDQNLSYEKVDLTSSEEISSFVERIGPKISNLTLIHSAGLKIDGLSIEYNEADWDQMMSLNLKGSFLLSKALLPFMIEEQWGRIIHFSSLGATSGSAGAVAYSTAKTGILGMSRALAKEYARFNITSNVLVLGHFPGGMYEALSPEVKKELLSQVPSRKLGDVTDIVNAVNFLIKSGYVNGATINIDGGI